MNEVNESIEYAMTSLDVAEATGKQHAHVMRDIRSLLAQGVDESNFGLKFRISKLGNGAKRKDPFYELTPKGCLILASGYDALLREKIIDRLEEWETGKRKPQDNFEKSQKKQESIEAKVRAIIAAVDGMSKTMNMPDKVKAIMYRENLERLGIAVPQEASDSTYFHRPEHLLDRFGINISLRQFYDALYEFGYSTKPILLAGFEDGATEYSCELSGGGKEYGIVYWVKCRSAFFPVPYFFDGRFKKLISIILNGSSLSEPRDC